MKKFFYNKYTFSFFKYITLSFFCIIVLLSLVLASFYTNTVVSINNNNIMELLKLTEHALNKNITSIQYFEILIYNNPLIMKQEFLNYNLNSSFTQQILSNYKLMLPVVDEIIILDEHSSVAERAIYENLKNNQLELIMLEDENNNTKFYMLYDGDHNGKNAVILSFSNKIIQELLNASNKNTYTDIQIVDANGNTMIYNNSHEGSRNISSKDYYKEILTSPYTEGHFITKINNQKTIITFLKNKHDWYLIQYTPYNIIENRINNIRTTTIIVAAIMVLLLLTITYVLSKKLNNPIEKMQAQVEDFEKEKTKYIQAKVNEFLYDFMLHGESYSIQELEENLSLYSLPLNLQDNYAIVLIKFSEQQYLNSKYKKEQILNIKENLSAIIEKQLCDEVQIQHIIIATHVNEIAIITYNDNQYEYNANRLNIISQKIYEHMSEYNVNIKIGISSVRKGIFNVPFLYQECCCALEYYYLKPNNTYIDYNSIVKQNESKHYMHEKEIYISNLLNNKEYDIITQTLKNLLDELKNTSLLNAKIVTERIIVLILQYIYNNEYINLSEEFEKIQQLPCIDDIYNKLINLLSDSNHKTDNDKYIRIIENVKLYVKENFDKDSLCLAEIGIWANMSPTYLGRIFKNATGISVAEYISNYRLERAYELLKETNLNITEIAEKVGLTNRTYFSTQFKKKYGVLPSKVR